MFTTPRLQKRVLHALFAYAAASARDIPFAITYWDGAAQRFGQGEPRFTLRLCDRGALALILDDFEMGFAEAYMRGRLDVTGDLSGLVAVASRTMQAARGEGSEACAPWLARTLKHLAAHEAGRFARRSHRRQQADVARHYDLSNDFYRLWLDESLTYSCAYFHAPEDTLEQAQRQKIDHSLHKLRLAPGEALLDIGCGWGALILRAAGQYGARALGITLSQEQYTGACDSIQAQGLDGRTDVRLCHYETLARARKQFDKIVSIGMIEHVGKAHLAEFAHAVARMLRPGGLALLHQITSPREAPFNRWMDKYIFPGAYLPTVPELLGHFASEDLRVLDVENLRPHYRMTLDRWSDRFERAADRVQDMFGEEFVRMWRLYLRSCSACFGEGMTEIHQILVSRGTTDALPLTRADLYA